MSTLEKLKDKFFNIPVPNDITMDQIIRLAQSYGCQIKSGGKHPVKVVDKESGTVIPIPRHGKYVQEAYISQLKTLFNEIDNRNEE